MIKSLKAKICILFLIFGILIYPLVIDAFEKPKEMMIIPYLTETISQSITYEYHEGEGIIDVTIIPYDVARTDPIETTEVLWIDALALYGEDYQSALIDRYLEGKKTIIVGNNQPISTLADYFGFLEKKSSLQIQDDSSVAGYLVQKVAGHEVIHSILYLSKDMKDGLPIDTLIEVSRKDFTDFFELID